MSNIAKVLSRRQDRGEGLGTNKKAIPYNKQDYQTLKQECLEKNTLFCDPTFPAEPASLGHNELGPQSDKTIGVEWKRPKDICPNPQFIVDGATRTDICQGELGDCWLMAAIASLTLDKECLERVVPHGQSFMENYGGIFHFQLWQYGEWVDVVIDDRLPTRNGQLLFVQSADGSEFWSALLEKAYAKVNGSYEALSGGLTTEGFEDFTGGISESFELEKAPPHLFKLIQKALKLGSLMGCSIVASAEEAKEEKEVQTSLNLFKGHAYSITDAKEVHSNGRLVQLVRLRNPWGNKEWVGPWSDNSKEWDDVRPDEKAKLAYSADDGEFWMAYSDFIQEFSILEICNQTPDTFSSDTVSRWNYNQFEGDWRVGSTAGGCLNNPVAFCCNPQFVIKLEEEDDDPHDGEDGCTILVGLMQKDFRKNRRFGRVPNSIGFTIHKLRGRNYIHLGPDVLLYEQYIARSEYGVCREMTGRFKLPPGEYVIIPTTFDINCSGSFILRVFTEKEAASSCMDMNISANVEKQYISEGDVDPHFKQFFNQFAGNEVSVFELKNILDSVISKRTDVKMDGFSMETCRNIISLLDRDGSGKLGLVAFQILWTKIKKYLEAFKKHDKDFSGTMSSYEMRDAVKEAGFQLNNEVLQAVIARYANQEYTINFDSFVGCLIHLEMVYNIFKKLNKKDTGKIELDIVQCLCLAVS